MFILEPSDFDSFSKLFLSIQKDIDSIYNLVFTNGPELWTQNTMDFVKRSDPDIILNFSELSHDQLSLHFGIKSVDPNQDIYKTERYVTDLFSFSRRPAFFDKFKINAKEVMTVISGKELGDSDLSIFIALNFGVFEKSLKSHLAFTIFEKIKPKFLTTIEEALHNLHNNSDKFLNLTRDIGSFGSSGYGSSIYYKSYNTENFFDDKKPYIYVSSSKDLKAISHFWNTRSYYSNVDIAWVPSDLLPNIESIVTPETTFVCFDNLTKNIIDKVYSEHRIIMPSQLHFQGAVNRWAFFEHEQTITIIDNQVNIHHPSEKSFGLASSVGAFVLETRGLAETNYPKRRDLGTLYLYEGYDNALTPERFTRISEHGLAKYFLEISFTKEVDAIESITLPSFPTVLAHLFEDLGYDIRKTTKTSIFEQTLNLVGGVEKVDFIATKSIFNLIVAMTPKVRTEKVVTDILKATPSEITSDNIMEIVAEIKEKGAVNFPSVTLTIEEILNKCKPVKSATILPVIQKLYDSKIFLRGKYFDCIHCGNKLWLAINEINRINYCPECSNEINIPIFKNDKAEADHFRLNQLIVRAVDQGQLSTLLPLNLFFKQQFVSFEHAANIEVLKAGKLFTDIDLLIKIWKRMGMIECKTLQPFYPKQLEEFIDLALTFKSDFIGFSSLHERGSKELDDLEAYLLSKNLQIPAFIFTATALFAPKKRMIQRFFELGHRDFFPVGPFYI